MTEAPSAPFETLECIQIESAENDIRYRKEAYLTAAGWLHTSSTIGCYWLWFKTVDGKSYGCDAATAFRIQSTIDREAYADAHPEEFED